MRRRRQHIAQAPFTEKSLVPQARGNTPAKASGLRAGLQEGVACFGGLERLSSARCDSLHQQFIERKADKARAFLRMLVGESGAPETEQHERAKTLHRCAALRQPGWYRESPSRPWK